MGKDSLNNHKNQIKKVDDLNISNKQIYSWQAYLSKWIISLKRNRISTYKRPPLRERGEAVILPYIKRQRIFNLMVAIDTSSSISDTMLNNVFSYILNLSGNTLHFEYVFFFDTKVYPVNKNLVYSRKIKKIKGSGSINFINVFSCAKELIWRNRNIDGLIIFSDGHGTYPSLFPKIDTLWISSNKEKSDFLIPSWHNWIFLDPH